MDDLFGLEGKVVVLTGAGGFLGTHFSKALVGRGATLVAVDVGFPASWNVAAAKRITLDLRSGDAIEDAAESVMREFGGVHGLVNNAAARPSGMFAKFADYRRADWDDVVGVSLTAAFECAQRFGRRMVAAGSGSIVSLSSIYGLTGGDDRLYQGLPFNMPPAYAAAKAGVIGLTRYLATHLGPRGVRANALAPGGIYNGHDERFVSRYSDRVPMGRMGSPQDLVGALVFLLSDASGYVNGQTIAVDGGFTAW